MKRDKLIYTIVTVLFSVMTLGSAVMYFVKHAEVAQTFAKLGYPTYIVYPLAVVKILGLIAIWTRLSATLREWAYAGFCFEFLLAISAHLAANDGQFVPPIVALVILLTSYVFGKRAFAQEVES